jgi:hypothetical protein
MNTSSKSGSIGLNSSNIVAGTGSATNFNLAGSGTPPNPPSNATQRGSDARPQPGQMHTRLRGVSDIADCITDNIETPEASNVVA